jgi:hypothetical protein
MQKLIPHYTVFVCGITATAIGIASENPKETLIVDRTGLVANEFIDCYHLGSEEFNEVSPLGENLKIDLKNRNILDDTGKVHIPALAPVLFKLIRDYSIDTLLVTEIIEVNKIEDYYEITLHNNSGFQKVTANRIIDTTATAISCNNFKDQISSKSINAILHTLVDEPFPFNHSEIISNDIVSYHQGRFEKEIILKYLLNKEDDWIIARNKLHTYWQNRPQSIQKWQMASIASTFDISVKKQGPCEVDQNWEWLPSCAYENILEAIEVGVSYGKRLEVVAR